MQEEDEVDIPRLLFVGSGLYSALTATLHPLNVLKTRAQAFSSEQAGLGRLQLLERHDVVLEYLDAVDARTFRPFRGQMSDSAYVVIAAQVQDVRLIDNGPLRT